MLKLTSSIRRNQVAVFATVAVVLTIVLFLLDASHGSVNASNPTIPQPVNVKFEPGSVAGRLVISWGAAPSMPNGCSFNRTSYQIGLPNTNQFDDENDDTDSGARSKTYDHFWYEDDNGVNTKITLTGGTDYETRVRIYAKCGASYPSSSAVSVTAKAPYSGPATGFTASTGTTNASINLGWTNPTTPSGLSVTKREYRKKLSSASAWPGSWTQAGTGTSHTITGLTAGSNYDIQFRIYTKTGSGTGVATQILTKTSVTASNVSVGNVGSPAAVSGDANGEVDLSWTAASGASSYEYQSKKASASNWGSWTNAGTGTSKTITGLDAGVNYEFKLRGKASSVTGAASASVAAVAQFTANASAATGALQNTIDVTITAPAGLTVTKYEVRWKLSSASNYPNTGVGSWTGIGTSTSHTISGLTASTSYNVQVRAVFTDGDPNSTNSLPKTLTVTSRAAVKPPTNLSSSAGTAFGGLDLSWTAPTGETVTRYEYRYRANGGSYPTTNGGDVWTSGTTAMSKTISGLNTDGTGYDVQVRTVTSAGNSVAATISNQKPKALPAPTNFAATIGSTKGSIELTWTAVTGFTPARYEYRWKLTSAGNWPTSGTTGDWTAAGTAQTRTTATSATLTGLTANTSYTIQLRTVEGSAPNYSAPVSQTATSRAINAPTGFAAVTGTSPGSISISWTEPTGGTITAREFRIKAAGESTEFQGAWSTAGTSSPYSITGLDAGSSHDIQFRIGANGGHSVAVTVTASAGIVPPPTNVSASSGTNFGEINLAWSAPNGITPTGYRFRTKKSTESTYSNAWTSIASSATSHTITALMGNIEHDIQFSTVLRISGRSSDSFSEPVTVSASATPIPPPANPGAGQTATPGVALLQWAPPVEVETHGYQYRYRPQNGDEQSWSGWMQLPGAVVSTQVPGLEVGIAYQFEIIAQNGPLGSSPATAFAMEPPPAEPPTGLSVTGGQRRVHVTWETAEPGSSTGYRYRYRQTGASDQSWSDWFNAPLGDAESQSVTIYGLEQTTSYTIELVNQLGQTFSEAVTGAAETNLDIPLVNRISAATPAVSVSAGSRVALEVNVYDTQDADATSDADARTGMFEDVEATYVWTAVSGGSFGESATGRRATFNVPDAPGVYEVSAEIRPYGICHAHYVPSPGPSPCVANFTVTVSASTNANGLVVRPTNPPGPIPTSLAGADGSTYTVFTPEGGGTYSLNGVLVNAGAGAVPSNMIIGFRMESAVVDGNGVANTHDVAANGYRILGIDAQSAPLTDFRFNNAIPICLPVPSEFTSRLADVSVGRVNSDGGIVPIGQRLAPTTNGPVVCASLSRLPSTYVVVARVAEEPATVEATPEAKVEVGESAGDALLPDAGGFTFGDGGMALLLGFVFIGILLAVGGLGFAHRRSHR